MEFAKVGAAAMVGIIRNRQVRVDGVDLVGLLLLLLMLLMLIVAKGTVRVVCLL